MLRRLILSVAVFAALAFSSQFTSTADAQEHAFGRTWGAQHGSRNMQRFYHYPYVTYPHNYWGNEYFRSGNDMYHRYPAEMRTPVYNRHWHNYYPTTRRYHWGHHFILDVF